MASPAASDPAPIRDLLRLVQAEVVEVLEDLPDPQFSRAVSETVGTACQLLSFYSLFCSLDGLCFDLSLF